jgi:hypothetical protein
LAPDLERDFLHVARADIRERDYRKLAPGFRADVRRDSLHPLRRIRSDDVREIVHQSGWGGYLDCLRNKQKRDGLRTRQQSCRRWKTQQQCVQDLISLDFMAR